MKKNATPKLSSKWWKRKKAKTVGGQALLEALENYEEKLEEVESSRPTYEGFNELDKLLNAIHAVIPETAEEARTAKNARNTLAGIQKYPEVVEKEKAEIKIMRINHGKMIEEWEERLETAVKLITKIKPDYEELLEEAEVLLKMAPTSEAVDKEAHVRYGKLVEDIKERLDVTRSKEIDAYAPVRVPGPANLRPCNADRTDRGIAAINEANGLHGILEGRWGKVIKALDESLRRL